MKREKERKKTRHFDHGTCLEIDPHINRAIAINHRNVIHCHVWHDLCCINECNKCTGLTRDQLHPSIVLCVLLVILNLIGATEADTLTNWWFTSLKHPSFAFSLVLSLFLSLTRHSNLTRGPIIVWPVIFVRAFSHLA